MQKYVNNYETTLHAAINSTQTTIQVPVSTKFDDLAALTPPDYYLLTISDATNIEIVKVTDVGAGPIRTLTIERDVSDTAHGAFSFAAGASVKMNVTAESMNDLSQAASNSDYPPNYTVNAQTQSTSGTVNVPFTPLVIQQVNIDAASGITLNVTPGSSYGECIITLYRTNLSHAWPTLNYNGSVAPVAGDPPSSSDYNAKLLCRSEPGSGFLPNPFVTFEWITRSSAAAPTVPVAFGATPYAHGIVYSGNTLVINPSTQGLYHTAQFQASTTVDFFPSPWGTNLREIILYSEGYTGIPTVRFGGGNIVPRGTAPTAGASWALRVTLIGSYKAVFEWLLLATF